MTFRDRYGLAFTTSSATAADLYRDGIDRSLSAAAGAEETLAAAVAQDDGFALAHIAYARALQFRGAAAEARTAATRARELAPALPRRERQHIEAIATAVDGNSPRALELLHEHLAEFPCDAFAASMAMGVYGLIGFSGRLDRNAEQLAFCEPLAPHYGDDWWFLSQHAFSLNELFRTAEARPLAERSLALFERNGHASHTMAHVFYEEGDPETGAQFLDRWLVGYEPTAQLYGHVWWHLALFELAACRPEHAIAVYDTVLRPEVNQGVALGTVVDGAALLWRSALATGEQFPERWPEVAEFAARSFPKPGVTFGDLHCALAFAANHDEPRMGALIDALRQRLDAGRIAAGPVVLALAEGASAFAHGDYETAVRQLEPMRAEVVRIGGSHAQRDVFEETLLEA
ncbi:MAG: tetratricopeptide repeat protein, partial [Tepidiformaceae bacterium]